MGSKLLRGEDARRLDKEVHERANYYPELSKEIKEKINQIKYNPKTGLIEGTNPFYIAILNDSLMPWKERVASPRDVGEMLKREPSTLKNIKVDLALLFKGAGSPNSEYSEKLSELISLNEKETAILEMPNIAITNSLEDLQNYFIPFPPKETVYITKEFQPSIGIFSRLNRYGIPVFKQNGEKTAMFFYEKGLTRIILDKGDIIETKDLLRTFKKDGRIILTDLDSQPL